jgi:hypothetical protein
MTGRIKKQGGLIYGYSESYTGRGERERERERKLSEQEKEIIKIPMILNQDNK